jgi:AmiR/NasT family two-component response regulator
LTRVTILAQPGRVREGLAALLTGFGDALLEVSFWGAAQPRPTSPSHPDIYIVDLDAPESRAWLAQRRQSTSQRPWVALTNSAEQMAAAQHEGAAAILIWGFTAGELYLAVRRCLGTIPIIF